MKPHEKLGIAIADAGYTWTPDMRSAWEALDKEPKMTKLKPYGYVMKFESGIEVFNTEEYELPDDKRISSVPLYTHPVKELTDEEILEICDLGEWHRDDFAINFARAILRKAQEK